MNICLLGLSGSGKTCYLYTATHVLARGVEVNGHIISATSSNRHIPKTTTCQRFFINM